jgi:hypothetical protein
MKVYVITVYNTFANGTRYSEVSETAYRTIEEAREFLKNIGMEQSAFNGMVFEEKRESFNLSTGRFEKMRQALITEVYIEDENE